MYLYYSYGTARYTCFESVATFTVESFAAYATRPFDGSRTLTHKYIDFLSCVVMPPAFSTCIHSLILAPESTCSLSTTNNKL